MTDPSAPEAPVLRLGARTSPLARAQVDLVAAMLAERGARSTFVGVTTAALRGARTTVPPYPKCFETTALIPPMLPSFPSSQSAWPSRAWIFSASGIFPAL